MEYTKNDPSYTKYDIGEYTYGKPKVFTWDEGAKLYIGKFCSIAEEVKIFLGGNHRPDWVTTYPINYIDEYIKFEGLPDTKGDVTIKNDVWIGHGATILSGVTIGDGSVIGAQTVVSKSVEPYSIVVGNPGRTIKKRFDEETISRLLEIKWWDWDISRIKRNMPLLLQKDINKFINEYE